MATDKIIKYTSIPKNSKVSVPFTFKSPIEATTVTVAISALDADLVHLRGTASAGTWDGTTWNLGTVAADAEETLTVDFRTETVYSGPLTFTFSLSTEPGDAILSDNVVNVSIEESTDADAQGVAPAFWEGLDWWDFGAGASFTVGSYMDGNTWKLPSIWYSAAANTSAAGVLDSHKLGIPNVIYDGIAGSTLDLGVAFDVDTIVGAQTVTQAGDGHLVATDGTAGTEADDGTADSAFLDLSQFEVRLIADGTTVDSTSVTVEGMVHFHDTANAPA